MSALKCTESRIVEIRSLRMRRSSSSLIYWIKNITVTCATKQSGQDSKDTDATNSCPIKVQATKT